MDITLARIVLGLMALVGIYDIYLMKMNRATISQYVQRLWPKHIDTVIFFGLMALAWWWWGEIGFIKILYGVLACHFFIQQPRS
jgi:hypothetical protein